MTHHTMIFNLGDPEQLRHDLRTLRVSVGLSQAQLGQRIGVKKAAVSNYETGRTGVSCGLLARWAEACGWEIEVRGRSSRPNRAQGGQ